MFISMDINMILRYISTNLPRKCLENLEYYGGNDLGYILERIHKFVPKKQNPYSNAPEFGPPYSIEDIIDFEFRNDIKLPWQFRLYLTEVSRHIYGYIGFMLIKLEDNPGLKTHFRF